MLSFCIVERRNTARPSETAAGAKFAPRKLALDPREFMAGQGRGFNSAKAEAIGFLRGLFAGTTHHKVREIEQEARARGLLGANQPLSQCRALRDARLALRLVAMREGFGRDGTWVWAKPEALEAQQEQGERQSQPAGEADPPEQPLVPSAQSAASVASPPIAPTQLQDRAERPATTARAVL
jgi:hypothetical protein